VNKKAKPTPRILGWVSLSVPGTPHENLARVSGQTELALDRTVNSLVGTVGTKTPPKDQVAFLFPVPGTGPFDSLAKSARSLTVPGLDAQKGRKLRDPLGCPEPGTHLTNRSIQAEFAVILVSNVEDLHGV
jgi:hypothetical protein